MRISRRSVAFAPSTIKRRVELLPQSSAATTSVTDVVDHEFGELHFGSDQFADRIVRAHEVVSEVGVQALHADARTPDAATRLRTLSAYRGATTALGVLLVRRGQRLGVDEVL